MQKLFFIILFLLEMNVDAMSFWQTVEQFASNPEELLSRLAEVNDINAKYFCDCFKKDNIPESEFKKITSTTSQKEVLRAAQFISESLYKKATQEDWQKSLSTLKEAQRFASILTSDSFSFFQKDEQKKVGFWRDLINSMISDRQAFVDAVEESKLALKKLGLPVE